MELSDLPSHVYYCKEWDSLHVIQWGLYNYFSELFPSLVRIGEL